MNTHAAKRPEHKSHSVANGESQLKSNSESTFQFVDNRPEAIAQRKLQEIANNSLSVSQLRASQDMANNSPQAKQTTQLWAMAHNHSDQQQSLIQRQENNTGLPNNLKSGIENLSGYSMDDVNVHYNSDKPAQLQAHAYAQGSDIHLASGQEKHLPHEAWHVVQQKQGRVKPTMQMKGGVNINDDKGLENEADVMGAKALNTPNHEGMPAQLSVTSHVPIIQKVKEGLEINALIQQILEQVDRFTELNAELQVYVLNQMPNDRLSAFFGALTHEAQRYILTIMPNERLSTFFGAISAEQRVYVLNHLPNNRMSAFFDALTAEQRQYIVSIMPNDRLIAFFGAITAEQQVYILNQMPNDRLSAFFGAITAGQQVYVLNHLPNNRMGDFFDALSAEQRQYIVTIMPNDRLSAFFGALTAEQQVYILNQMPNDRLSAFFGALTAEQQVYVLNQMPNDRLSAFFGAITAEQQVYVLNHLPNNRMGDFFDVLTAEQRQYIVTIMPNDRLSAFLVALTAEQQVYVLNQMPSDRLSAFFGAITAEQQVYILNHLPNYRIGVFFDVLTAEQRQYIVTIMPNDRLVVFFSELSPENQAYMRGIMSPEKLEAMSTTLKKIAENPDLWDLPGAEVGVARLDNKANRKANRISGLVKQKCGGIPNADEAAKRMDQFVITGAVSALAEFAHLDPNPRSMEYNRFLLAATRWMNPGSDEIRVLDQLCLQQRAQIEGREDKVIAHRGDGATFDKMGRYTDRPGFEKLYPHYNENSPESTDKFLRWYNRDDTSLSGIECDIYLTADGVPYVTHTQNVEALLQQEAGVPKDAWSTRRIQEMGSGEISPRFMSLERWLGTIDHFVEQADTARQAEGRELLSNRAKQLRVEIEMKQAEFGNPHDMSAWAQPSKVVSHFLKATPRSHFYEVAMFNNSNAPVAAHNATRNKTELSQVTFGKGGSPEHAEALPEIRFGMHQRGIRQYIDSGALEGKVITFAPGLDHPGFDKLDQQLDPVGWTLTEIDVTIEQSIQSARLDILVQAIKVRQVGGGGPLSVHVLTDHGNKGARNLLGDGAGDLRAGGLAVGNTPKRAWDPATVAGHYARSGINIDADRLRAIVEQAILENDTPRIGRTLITEYPGLL